MGCNCRLFHFMQPRPHLEQACPVGRLCEGRYQTGAAGPAMDSLRLRAPSRPASPPGSSAFTTPHGDRDRRRSFRGIDPRGAVPSRDLAHAPAVLYAGRPEGMMPAVSPKKRLGRERENRRCLRAPPDRQQHPQAAKGSPFRTFGLFRPGWLMMQALPDRSEGGYDSRIIPFTRSVSVIPSGIDALH